MKISSRLPYEHTACIRFVFHEILANEISEVDSGYSRTWIRNFRVGGSIGVGTLSFAQTSKFHPRYELVDGR